MVKCYKVHFHLLLFCPEITIKMNKTFLKRGYDFICFQELTVIAKPCFQTNTEKAFTLQIMKKCLPWVSLVLCCYHLCYLWCMRMNYFRVAFRHVLPSRRKKCFWGIIILNKKFLKNEFQIFFQVLFNYVNGKVREEEIQKKKKSWIIFHLLAQSQYGCSSWGCARQKRDVWTYIWVSHLDLGAQTLESSAVAFACALTESLIRNGA